jgi:hypothetical protein
MRNVWAQVGNLRHARSKYYCFIYLFCFRKMDLMATENAENFQDILTGFAAV